MRKRDFLKLGAAVAATSLASGGRAASQAPASRPVDLATPIAASERLERVRRAQSLMARNDLDAIVLEPGASMTYFSGIRWWRSERLTAVIIPREGDVLVVTPFFEEPSVRESLVVAGDVRTWHEHESPFAVIADWFAQRKIKRPVIGIENSVRFFAHDGLARALPDATLTDARNVVQGCRMFKTIAELRLMRIANEVTLRAYEQVYQQLDAGMRGEDVKALMNRTQQALGGSNAWSLALVGPGSAYPHGTREKAVITKGEILLMDCGCSVHDYQSDISRPFVFGDASKRQREVWETVNKGQQIAFKTAQPGVAAGQVDDAVRDYYESLGYGPDYQTPGLSHRTGHGIGMEGHEPINFVRGETTPLAPGMCLSNEPGLYIYGEFGVRLEDCLYISRDGPRWFTVPPVSLERPLGVMGPVL